MPTATDIRKLALALEGVTEVDHFARPSFRTAKRIFAVIRPDGLWLNLPVERKEFLLEADPAVFVKYMWGKTVNVIVQPERISQKEFAALIREAWEFSLPPPAKKAKAAAKHAHTPEQIPKFKAKPKAELQPKLSAEPKAQTKSKPKTEPRLAAPAKRPRA